MLELAGADRVLTMDLHAGQIQGFFTIPVDHMTALPLFAQLLPRPGARRRAGRLGRRRIPAAPRCRQFAEMIGADFAIMNKTRPAHDQVEVTEVIGRVPGRSRSSATTDRHRRHADRRRRRAEEHGATAVYVSRRTASSRGDALERLGAASIDGIVVTDTVPIDPLAEPDNLTVLTVSGLLAETIWNVFSDESVSAIFGGENQLF